MRKRELLADLLFQSRLIGGFCYFFAHRKLVILNYHRISPNSMNAPTLFHDGVFSVNADQFSRQMSWLKRHTRILSEQDLIDIISNPHDHQGLNCPSVAITFDDGYYDNYAIAYPILRALQMPAIFFICTEMIWERKLRWWDILAYLIKKSRKHSIIVDDHQYVLGCDCDKTIGEISLKIKHYTLKQTDNCIRSISEAAEIDLPPDEIQDRELMTREQIYEIATNKMAIGSHTHTHQALSSLDERQQHTELRLSKELLEQTTSQPIHSVSYPYGLHQYIPLSIPEVARKCGYRLGFTSSFGVNYLTEIDSMALKRFSGELDKVSTLSLLAVWPELFTY